MFFRFTDNEIQDSKNSIFPLLQDFELSSFIINSDNNSNLINFSIAVRDSYTNPKIFNILDTKKYMKIKVFEITSQQIKTSVANINNITDLNKLISDNKLNFVDLSAGYEFNGSNTNKKAHYIENGFLLLNYSSQYVTNNNLNNYSLGIVFYYDFENYTNDNNISNLETAKKIFFSNIKVIDIYQNSRILTFSGVQDLRITNSIFNKTISDTFNQEQNYNKTLKLLSEKQFKNVKIGQYFSNAYFSRKKNGELGLLFNFNKYKFLRENSQYINNFIDSPLADQYLQESKIASIKIVRRQVDKKTKKPIFDSIEKTFYKVAESGQISDKIVEKSNIDGSIKEIDLITDDTVNISSFEVTDKNVFLKSYGIHQYGVQINILDGFTDFLNTIRSALDIHNIKIKNYLEQTNKIIKTSDNIIGLTPHNEIKLLSLNGYYNVINNKFSNYFTSFVYPQIFEKDLLTAINLMVSIIKFFNKSIDEEKTILSLINLVNPSIATYSTINYFLQLHTKFINNINSLLKNNNNTFINVEHWFINEYVDCSEKINIGYKFLNLSSETGIGTIEGQKYKNKILNDLKRYSVENSLFEEQKNKLSAFIAVEEINSKNFTLNLSNLDNDVNYYDSFNYAELELDIKNYLFDKELDKEVSLSSAANSLAPEVQTLKQKMNLLFNKLNIVNNNSNIFLDDSRNIRENNNSSAVQDNNLNDPTLLYLALAKNIELEKNTFKNTKLNINNINISDPKYKDLINELPYHLELIFKEKSKFFNNDYKYLSNLTLNSKFLLLFNTLHKVQILTYENNNIKNELWKNLTTEVINSLNGNTYLCRIQPCNAEEFNLKNFIDIKLPIYNKYFILTNINPLKTVNVNTILLPKIENALTLNRQLLNTQPVVERYARSYQNIPVFSPVSNFTDSAGDPENGSVPVIFPEDQPYILQDEMKVPNSFDKAFDYPEAKELVLQGEIYSGNPDMPSFICGPDLKYKLSDGKGGYKNNPQALTVNLGDRYRYKRLLMIFQ